MALSPSNGARNPNLPVQPGPVPLTVKFRIVRASTGNLLAMEVYAPTGLSVFFFDPDSADGISKLMAAESLKARSNLVIAPAGRILP